MFAAEPGIVGARLWSAGPTKGDQMNGGTVDRRRTGRGFGARLTAVSLMVCGAVAVAATAHAQLGSGGGPIEIKADRLEVLDAERRAVYSGNVDASQGETRLRSERLIIEFDPPAQGATSTSGLGSGFGEVRKLIAEQQVFYITPGERVRGDRAEYDYVADTITLTGDVVLSRGEDGVINGTRLVLEVGSGRATVTSEGKPVFSILTPKERPAEERDGGAPTR